MSERRLPPRPSYGVWGVRHRRRFVEAAFMVAVLAALVAVAVYLLIAF
jgi:hypothetical protein